MRLKSGMPSWFKSIEAGVNLDGMEKAGPAV